MTILSATVGAKIFINDKLIGLVPYNKPIKLKPGSYTVKVTKRGYTDYLDVFKIVAGKTTDLEIDLIGFQGILKISCTPPDAEIYLGKKYLGAPPIDKDVTVGKGGECIFQLGPIRPRAAPSPITGTRCGPATASGRRSASGSRRRRRRRAPVPAAASAGRAAPPTRTAEESGIGSCQGGSLVVKHHVRQCTTARVPCGARGAACA